MKEFNRKYRPFKIDELPKYTKEHDSYNEKEMQNEAIREYVQALSLIKESVAVSSCIAYLRNKGYTVVNLN